MPKQRRKIDFPQKNCIACGRPFSWRKKWERDWENVRYCSKRCGAVARRQRTATPNMADRERVHDTDSPEKHL